MMWEQQKRQARTGTTYTDATDLVRYSIGLYQPEPYTKQRKQQWLQEIRIQPADVRTARDGLKREQLQMLTAMAAVT